MAKDEIHIGDSTKFVATIKDGDVGVDISSATILQFFFRKQTGATVSATGSFTTDGTDFKMEYKAPSGTFIDTKGEWQIQGYVNMPSGAYKSDVLTFRVFDNII